MMATADSVKDKISGLITKANETTGNRDTDLTSAVNALISGYGSGGDISTDNLLAKILDGTIAEFVSDDITKIVAHALRGREYLTKISLPNCLELGTYAFAQCRALTDIDLPKCKTVNTYAFQEIGAEYVSLPSVTSAINTLFLRSTNLKTVDFVAPSSITTNAFNGCTAFDTLILRKSESIVPLQNVAAFIGSPFYTGGTGGTVYVPSVLIESYQTATNWVTLYEAGTCNFTAIEGSKYE